MTLAEFLRTPIAAFLVFGITPFMVMALCSYYLVVSSIIPPLAVDAKLDLNAAINEVSPLDLV